ncbi:UDP-glycosyltransferase 72B3 [Morella rubra]|uniref:UDP-glycosyltransferase 72B3 n=1 Tax=Morella rubra TaxID=262757 RepID=A0A6A1UGQ8_9ROSI|nr:UDP-glycosyltransferase 72B3 [Morella rubra]
MHYSHNRVSIQSHDSRPRSPPHQHRPCLSSSSELGGPPHSTPWTQISRTITLSLPSLRDVLKSLVATNRLAALVVDLFASEALEVAKGIESLAVCFRRNKCNGFVFALAYAKAGRDSARKFREVPEPLKLPGWSIPFKVEIFQTHFRTDKLNDWFKHHHVDESGCISWLENQPSGSVLFVSFGSGGTLSFDQLTELALGLELSGQRFMWVVRSPNNGPVDAAYVSNQSHQDPLAFLPNGEREEIAKVIKDLMASEDGKRVQNRMKDLKIAAEKALTGDESSKRALSELASKLASN